ncbi:hypothetical protein [Shinella sp. BYT-45]|uniref:hypothetical protein n=1 Tax=Shinella sp. BYT-45 TaxID=3377377 RepID=UPI00397F3702
MLQRHVVSAVSVPAQGFVRFRRHHCAVFRAARKRLRQSHLNRYDFAIGAMRDVSPQVRRKSRMPALAPFACLVSAGEECGPERNSDGT